jgi:amino acid transporter
MADVEKANYEIDAGPHDGSDHDVRKGSMTEAAGLYGESDAEREHNHRSTTLQRSFTDITS